MPGRRHGRVEPRRGVDVKTGVGGQAQVPNDALKVLAVIACQEESMRAECLIGLIHPPEETNDRTGESLALQLSGDAIPRQKILVYVWQIGVGEDDIRLQTAAIREIDSASVGRVHVDPF